MIYTTLYQIISITYCDLFSNNNLVFGDAGFVVDHVEKLIEGA